MTSETILDLLDEARTNHSVGLNLGKDNYTDMIGAASRLHLTGGKRFQEPKTFARPGKAPPVDKFRLSTSYVNVAKLCCLEDQNLGLYNLWATTFEQRVATGSLDAMAGQELGYLCDAALQDMVISVDEAHRIRDRYRQDLGSIRMQICRFYKTGPCHSGEDCAFIHTTPEHTFKDPIFINWD